MKMKNNTIYLLIMFVGILIILGGFIYGVNNAENFVMVPYLNSDIEEGTRITDKEIGFKEISNSEYNKISNEIYADWKNIINKCSSKDVKADSYFYINDLKECESDSDINVEDGENIDNEDEGVQEENNQEKVCNDYKKYPDDGSDNLITLSQYSDKQNISKLEKIVNLFGGRAFTNNSDCDFVSVFEYINEGNKVIFSNFKDENEMLFIFLNYYFENVGKDNVKTTKCYGGSGECYILPINDVKKYSKTLFNFDIVDEHVDFFGYKDSNNYYINTDLSGIMSDIEKKDFVSVGIDSKSKDIHYKNKYFVYTMNKEIVINYVFKLNDEGNYYLYSMNNV